MAVAVVLALSSALSTAHINRFASAHHAPLRSAVLSGTTRAVTPCLALSPDAEIIPRLIAATRAAVANVDEGGQEAYGDWCRQLERGRILDALRGVRAQKMTWWLDSPRPLRAVVTRDTRLEISVVALPGSCVLPAAAWPRGSVLLCHPLHGQFEVRRLRFDITGKTEKPMELMKRVLRQGDSTLLMPGGSCHEFTSTPGIGSAFLQVAMLPPTSSLPTTGGRGEGSIGWRRPPGEACDENTDVVCGVTLGVDGLEDLVVLERPSSAAVELDRQMDAGGVPDTVWRVAIESDVPR